MTALWPFLPQKYATESLEWHTHVIRCHSAEQRLGHRPFPRQEFAYTFHFSDDDLWRARQLARQLADGEEFYLPVWNERTEVGTINAGTVTLPVDSTHTCYSTNNVLVIWSSITDYEVCTISGYGSGTITVNPATTATHTSALVMPLRLVRFAQDFEASMGAGPAFGEADLRFEAIATEDLSAETSYSYPTYRGYPVVTDATVVKQDAKLVQKATLDEIDSVSGGRWSALALSAPVQTGSVAWHTANAAELWKLRAWLHQRRGMQKAFWLPSFYADLQITTSIEETDTQIEIAAIGYASLYSSPSDFVIFTSVAQHFFRVTSAEAGDPGRELLNLTAAAGFAVPTVSIVRASHMVLSRFDADRVEIHHSGGGQADTDIPVIEASE